MWYKNQMENLTLKPFQLWMRAVLLFWVSTFIITFIDYAGWNWFDVSWLSGSYLFPNKILGPILVLLHVASFILLVLSGRKIFNTRGGYVGFTVSSFIVIFTGAICYSAFLFWVLWYHLKVLGKTI